MNALTQPLLLTLLAGAAGAQAQSAGARAPIGPLFAPPPQVAYDEPGDGRLWARGTTYKASFGPEGATYYPYLGPDAPRNQPLRMRLASARVGERELALTERASWSRAGDRVVLDRGPVDVCYRLEPEAVEQTFVLEAFAPDADLVVELELESEEELRPAGAGFEALSERGGVRYGAATALDADGRALALESRLEGRGLAIRVPREWLAGARQPVVIDPMITTYSVNGGANQTWSGDLAYDATHGLFLHVFTVEFAWDDRDVYSVPVQLDGTVRHDLGAWIDVSDENWVTLSVANSNADDNFLIASAVNSMGVRGRLRQLPGLGVGPVLQISAPGLNCSGPSVGGEMIEGGSSNYCVAWGQTEGDGDRTIRYRILSSTGAALTAVLPLETGPGLYTWRPRVSKSNGVGLGGERCWNVVWMREAAPEQWDVRGAQIAPNGTLKTLPFVVDDRAIDHRYPSVSSPLLAPSGGPRDFLTVYEGEVNGQRDLHASLMKGAELVARYDIGQLEAEVVGGGHLPLDQTWAVVATDGSQFVIAYCETAVDAYGGDIRLSTFHHNDDRLIPVETRMLVAGGGATDMMLPLVAAAHDSGIPGAPLTALAWSSDVQQVDTDTQGGFYLRPAGWDPLGEVTCAGLPNSTGDAATFRAYGSGLPGDNRLFLDCDNLPLLKWGQFLMSSQQASTPYGNGFLCLAAPHLRLNSTKQNSWTTGTAGSQLDLTALPQGIAIQPGETWYFQYWYRDAGSFSFSNALGITFQ